MRFLTINLVLALVWAAATGSPSLGDLALGFALGYLALAWLRPLLGETRYFEKLPRVITFALWFFGELLWSNLQVAWEVITPGTRRRPGIIEIPLEAKTDLEITLLAILITLTPGTVTLDVRHDRRTMLVHAMFIEDPETERRRIREGFERRVIELLR